MSSPFDVGVGLTSRMWFPSPRRRRAIAIYHLHGFVPLKANYYSIDKADGSISDADPSAESLVFTDEQYWRMAGNPTGFASRIFCNALSDRTEESAKAEEEARRLDIVGSTLSSRGVGRITIPSWDSKVFHDWWKECFWA